MPHAPCPACWSRGAGSGRAAICGEQPRRDVLLARAQVVSVSEHGTGIKKIRPTALLNMLKARGMKVTVEETPEEKQAIAAAGAAAFRKLLSRWVDGQSQCPCLLVNPCSQAGSQRPHPSFFSRRVESNGGARGGRTWTGQPAFRWHQQWHACVHGSATQLVASQCKIVHSPCAGFSYIS